MHVIKEIFCQITFTPARFSICHSEIMAKIDNLLLLRNELSDKQLGGVLLAYLQDFVTEQAVKNLDAVEIKGMCRIIQQIKTIPEQVENERKH